VVQYYCSADQFEWRSVRATPLSGELEMDADIDGTDNFVPSMSGEAFFVDEEPEDHDEMGLAEREGPTVTRKQSNCSASVRLERRGHPST
jgi:hypothetical protein